MKPTMSGVLLACAVSATMACQPQSSFNDDPGLGSMPMSDRDPGKDAGKDAGKNAGKDSGVVTGSTKDAATAKDARVATDTGTEESVEDAATGVSSEDASSEDASVPVAPAESVVNGSASRAGCTTTTKAAGGMCAGWYCGVTAEQIGAELNSTICPMMTGEALCSGEFTKDYAACSRQVKSSNPTASTSVAREMVMTCVYATDPSYEALAGEDCLGCFGEVADCVATNCLIECLAGESASCDTCRLSNNCNQLLSTCGELPSPY